MERKDYPTISETVAVLSTSEDVTIGFGKPDFSVPRDMFMLSLGTLRAALPENYGMAIAQEISDALDYETGVLDADKLSPELATLTIAFSEYARLQGDRQLRVSGSSSKRMTGLTAEGITRGQAQVAPQETIEKDLIGLGAMLREKRKEIGIPQATLAERAQIGRTTLNFYERATINPRTRKPSQPSLDKLLRLTTKLGMSDTEKERAMRLAGYSKP